MEFKFKLPRLLKNINTFPIRLNYSLVSNVLWVIIMLKTHLHWILELSGEILMFLQIGLVGRVFANSSWDRGSIPSRVILKTQKMVLDPTLINTQH